MSLFHVNSDSISSNILDGEAVVIHTGTSDYFGFNLTGTRLWKMMTEQCCSKSEMIQITCEIYKNDKAKVAADIEKFLDRLLDANLVVIPSESTVRGDYRAEYPTPTEPYEPPDFVKFGDLDTLILSGE